MKPETEFPTLFQQVCQEDCYRLQSVPFQPDVILDIGANVGVFCSYARFLFPHAKIVCLEPNPRNWGLLIAHTGHLPGVRHVNKALGNGPLWRVPATLSGPYFGAVERYVSEGSPGFPADFLNSHPEYQRVAGIETISLAELFRMHVRGPARVLAKIDCEGGEHSIFDDRASLGVLGMVDYLAMEVHFALDGTGPAYESERPTIRQNLMGLALTHDCVIDEPHNLFFATRKAPHD